MNFTEEYVKQHNLDVYRQCKRKQELDEISQIQPVYGIKDKLVVLIDKIM